jgi:hypothetical protein
LAAINTRLSPLHTTQHTGERRRQAARRDRRAAEAGSAVQAALASTVLLHLLPPSSRLDVAVQVLASDGSALAAAITAAGAAVADAGIAMRDVLAAASATKLDGACLLDPNQAEAAGGGPAVLVAAHVGALPAASDPSSASASTSGGNAVVAFQADGSPAASVEEVEALAALAADGCRAVGGVVRAALGEAAARCAAVRDAAKAGGAAGVAAGGGDADMVGA